MQITPLTKLEDTYNSKSQNIIKSYQCNYSQTENENILESPAAEVREG